MNSVAGAHENWPGQEQVEELLADGMRPYAERFEDNAKLDVVTAEEADDIQRQYEEVIGRMRAMGRRLQAEAESTAHKPLVAQQTAEDLTPLVKYGHPGKVAGVVRVVKESAAEAAAEVAGREALAREVGSATMELEQSGRAIFAMVGTVLLNVDACNTKASGLKRQALGLAADFDTRR